MADDLEDMDGLMRSMQRQLAERTEDLVLTLLTGRTCACGEQASHVELGPERFQWPEDAADMSGRVTRTVRFLCTPHWPYGDCTIAEVAHPTQTEGNGS